MIHTTLNKHLTWNYHSRTFKLLSYVRHLFVNALLFQVPDAGPANIRNKLAESISRGCAERKATVLA